MRREEGVPMRSGEAEKTNGRFGFRSCVTAFFGGARRAIASLSSLPPASAGRGAHPSRALHLNNSINIDKFTGFFDKFLKMVVSVIDCNSIGYRKYMSGAHSDPSAKKVFRLPRISPQPPAFPLAPVHRTGGADFGAASRYVGAGRPGISIAPRTHSCELEPPSRFMASRIPRPPSDSGSTRNS